MLYVDKYFVMHNFLWENSLKKQLSTEFSTVSTFIEDKIKGDKEKKIYNFRDIIWQGIVRILYLFV